MATPRVPAITPFLDGARAGCAEGAARDLATLLPPGAGPGLLAPRALLERLFHLSPSAFLRRMPGRETLAWPSDGSALVVKRFRGGETRDWWYERLRGAVRSPARREGENLRDLASDGLPVPRWVAWVEERGALRRASPRRAPRDARSGVVMAAVPHRRTLQEVLAAGSGPERRAWLDRLADLVARLHAKGWIHRDLYLHQVVVDGDRDLVLLDVGRARRSRRLPRRRWHVKDLAALHLSAPGSVTAAERLRTLQRYLRARGLEGPVRPWVRSVVRKARRLSAHVPRHVDPSSESAEVRP